MQVKYEHHAEAYDARGFSCVEPWGDQNVYGSFTEERCGGPEEQLQAAREWARTTFRNTPSAVEVRITTRTRRALTCLPCCPHASLAELTNTEGIKMSTHALVGVATSAEEYKATFVSHDGYPTHIGPFLQKVIARDSVYGAADALLSRLEWSGFDADQPDEPSRRVGHYDVVPGYGEAYPADDLSLEKLTETRFGSAYGGDYAYVLVYDTPGAIDHLRVLDAAGETLVLVPLEHLAEVPMACWTAIEEGYLREADRLLGQLGRRYVVVYTFAEGTATRAEGPYDERVAFVRRNELLDEEGADSVQIIEHASREADVRPVDYVDQLPLR